MSRIFTFIIVISLIFQVGFSFYYSNAIIDQNNQLDWQQTEINQVKLNIELVETNMADLSSINHINQSTSSASIPIIQSLKINH